MMEMKAPVSQDVCDMCMEFASFYYLIAVYDGSIRTAQAFCIYLSTAILKGFTSIITLSTCWNASQ